MEAFETEPRGNVLMHWRFLRRNTKFPRSTRDGVTCRRSFGCEAALGCRVKPSLSMARANRSDTRAQSTRSAAYRGTARLIVRPGLWERARGPHQGREDGRSVPIPDAFKPVGQTRPHVLKRSGTSFASRHSGMDDSRPTPSHSPLRLLDRVRQEIRVRHYSRRTEQAYVAWIRRFIVFHGRRHPRELGESDVTVFVSSLAERGVSASTQNQALSAILFLFEVVVGQRSGWMNDIVRAQRPVRLPVVLSRDEVIALLSQLRALCG